MSSHRHFFLLPRRIGTILVLPSYSTRLVFSQHMLPYVVRCEATVGNSFLPVLLHYFPSNFCLLSTLCHLGVIPTRILVSPTCLFSRILLTSECQCVYSCIFCVGTVVDAPHNNYTTHSPSSLTLLIKHECYPVDYYSREDSLHNYSS
jgi:hypothetical protein